MAYAEKMNFELASEIRRRYSDGRSGAASKISQQQLSDEYDVSLSTISKIINGGIWRTDQGGNAIPKRLRKAAPRIITWPREMKWEEFAEAKPPRRRVVAERSGIDVTGQKQESAESIARLPDAATRKLAFTADLVLEEIQLLLERGDQGGAMKLADAGRRLTLAAVYGYCDWDAAIDSFRAYEECHHIGDIMETDFVSWIEACRELAGAKPLG